MSTNLSKINRDKMIDTISKIKANINDEEIIKNLSLIEYELTKKKYGLVWEEHEEKVDEELKTKIPTFEEVKDKEIISSKDEKFNFLLEGDNLHSLYLLEKTHKGKIDVIKIDPPYNRGENDFIYDDKIVDENDTFRHSKWLSFMNRRLEIAKRLLKEDGIIIINIDEHESAPLLLLLNEIFGENNNLGEIIWNKKNPKGDAQGISTMHETIFCFAKNKEFLFLNNNDVCKRKKANAEKMINKAKSLYKKMNKRLIPDDIENAIKPFDYSDDIKKDFYVTYNLELINKEFQNWLKGQPFSNGEKAYKFIDDTGRIYRGVSMAWPNKKKAPDDYFIPLIHPVTGKACPVPERGWRNPPETMKKLLEDNRILFGKDESKQPERKYYLDENMIENTPSIYESADSSDNLLSSMGLSFDYAKPVSEVIYTLINIHPNPMVILDFFAGSGTTGQAILELNNEDGKNRQFILCTNNQNKICENTTYVRLKNVIEGYNNITGLKSNLKYYRTAYIPKLNTDEENIQENLLINIKNLIQLENGISIDNEKIRVILDEEEIDKFSSNYEEVKKCEKLYISTDILLTAQQVKMFKDNNVEIFIIPEYYFENEIREVQ